MKTMRQVAGLAVASVALLVATSASLAQSDAAPSAVDKRAQIEQLLQSEFAARRETLDKLFQQIEQERKELKALSEALAVLGITTPEAALPPAAQRQSAQPPAAASSAPAPTSAPTQAQPVVPAVKAVPVPPVDAQPLTAPAKGSQDSARAFDAEDVDAVLRNDARFVNRSGQRWEFYYNSVRMRAVADSGADRVRVMAYIRPARRTKDSQLERALEANYASSADARYGISDGKIYAVYAHPLSALDGDQLRAGLTQVARLAETFGTTYTSGDVTYVGDES